jgi:undecaprenyl-diphosphatase
MMTWWQALILGVVEGITEFLPISSTGHLIITSALLGLDGPETKSAVDAFNIVVQGGAILAVAGLYRARIAQMFRGVLGRDPVGLNLLINLTIAFLPAAFAGVFLDEAIESMLFHPGPVIIALAAGGVYMMVVEQWREGRFGSGSTAMRDRGIEELTPRQALTIGILQCIAMWPGTSRSMMTITGGLFAGLRPAAAAEFSFLLGLPTLGGACLYKLAKNVSNAGPEGNLFQVLGVAPALIGIVTAMISAALAIRWLVGFLSRRGLMLFGWYRILLAIVLLGLVVGGTIDFS